jgi:hypothetical protein
MALPAEDIAPRAARGVAEQVHVEATRVGIGDAAKELGKLLTDRLLAYIVNVRDVKTLTRWESGQVAGVRIESERRLRTAYEIAALLGRVEGPATIRAWFIGIDPYLADASPADAIHDGRLQDALNAARSFAAYGGMGS